MFRALPCGSGLEWCGHWPRLDRAARLSLPSHIRRDPSCRVLFADVLSETIRSRLSPLQGSLHAPSLLPCLERRRASRGFPRHQGSIAGELTHVSDCQDIGFSLWSQPILLPSLRLSSLHRRFAFSIACRRLPEVHLRHHPAIVAGDRPALSDVGEGG